jgi:hypothetical protein
VGRRAIARGGTEIGAAGRAAGSDRCHLPNQAPEPQRERASTNPPKGRGVVPLGAAPMNFS